MSGVLARKRGLSKAEFLNTGYELEKFTVQCVHSERVIPKRYRLTAGAKLMRTADAMCDAVIYANSIFPRIPKDPGGAEQRRALEEDLAERLAYQHRALRELQILLKDLRLLSEILPIKDNVLERWTELILKEEMLLKSWIQSDKARYK